MSTGSEGGRLTREQAADSVLGELNIVVQLFDQPGAGRGRVLFARLYLRRSSSGALGRIRLLGRRRGMHFKQAGWRPVTVKRPRATAKHRGPGGLTRAAGSFLPHRAAAAGRISPRSNR